MIRIFKNPLFYFCLAVFSVIAHNAVYALTKIEEPFFFSGFFIFSLIFLFSGISYLFRIFSARFRRTSGREAAPKD